MYGVIVCSRCNRAKGADLKAKTARCQCGNVLKLKETKKFFESSSHKEIAAAVARMNAELEGGVQEWEMIAESSSGEEGDDPHSKIVTTASSMTDQQEKLEFVARSLTETFGSFTRKELKKTLRMVGIRDVDGCLETMLTESIIYEPEPDVFRAV
jgi:hypothetical protein